jgi:glucokinase
MEYILGIDIGGTNLVAGCVASDGSGVEGLLSEPTRAEEGADGVVARILALGRRSQAALAGAVPGATVSGVGIGAPGPLDTQRGIVLLTPNLGWVDFPLRDRLSDGLDLSASLDNDANCAVLGEHWRGAARGTSQAIGITIGTGIGGGIILDGKLYHGASDCAGEVGHTTLEMNGRRCACGNYGCLEAYASGPAIARRAMEAVERGAESSLRAWMDADPASITAQVVYEAAEAGDSLAREVVQDTARILGAAIANLVNVFNPEVVVVCGGVTLAGESLFAPLRREVTRRAFRPAVEVCRIVPGALTGSAGVYGAARSFLDSRAG